MHEVPDGEDGIPTTPTPAGGWCRTGGRSCGRSTCQMSVATPCGSTPDSQFENLPDDVEERDLKVST